MEFLIAGYLAKTIGILSALAPFACLALFKKMPDDNEFIPRTSADKIMFLVCMVLAAAGFAILGWQVGDIILSSVP